MSTSRFSDYDDRGYDVDDDVGDDAYDDDNADNTKYGFPKCGCQCRHITASQCVGKFNEVIVIFINIFIMLRHGCIEVSVLGYAA